jgi:hypothetical protein
MLMLAFGWIVTHHDPSWTEHASIWTAAIADLHLFGNGLGSFAADFGRAEYAHNEPLHFVYELGVLALPILALALYLMNRTKYDDALVLVAILAISLFSFPLHMPVTGFAAALAAGGIARRGYLVRDSFATCAMDRGRYA